MKTQDICPTCGTSLGPLHDKKALRRCDSCNRVNPRGFYYCGYCASPMESTSHRAALSEIAAPEGGWPSLTRELVEVRFFMERGEIDEAFELLAILRERHPGHPELIEFKRSQSDGPTPDTQVNRVVDSVLSGSPGLSDPLPRRQAPKWNAPESPPAEGAPNQTRGHEVVPQAETTSRPRPRARARKRVVESSRSATTAEHAGLPPTIEADEEPTRVRMRTNRHAGLPGKQRVGLDPVPKRGGAKRLNRVTMLDGSLPGAGPVIAEGTPDKPTVILESDGPTDTRIETPQSPPTDGTGTIDAAEPISEALAAAEAAQAQAPTPGMTIAVPTLQPATPFQAESRGGVASFQAVSDVPLETEDDVTTERRRRGAGRRKPIRKRALKARKRSGRQTVVDGSSPEGETPKRRRGRQFGSHVLGRLGGKDNP